MLVGQDSRLKKIATSVETRTILFLDGIRYSAEIIDLAYNRLADTRERIRLLPGETRAGELGELMAAALSDTWTVVDSVDRLRELIQQVPGLDRLEPERQVFVRETQAVADLRNHVQHLRSEIDHYAALKAPVWGTLSWIGACPKTGRPQSYSLIPGTFFREAWAALPGLDGAAGVFYEQGVTLQVGDLVVELDRLHRLVVRFVAWFEGWCAQTFREDPAQHHAADILLTNTIRPAGEPPA